jgi:hypothetical protein
LIRWFLINAHIVIYFWALWPEVAGSVLARTCVVIDSVIPTNTHRETAGKTNFFLQWLQKWLQ